MLGDPTLYTRTDEVESAWRFCTTILDAWNRPDAPRPWPYTAGTWGPRGRRRPDERRDAAGGGSELVSGHPPRGVQDLE